MKRILFVVESLAGGGAEKVLLNLIKNIDKDKFDVTVFSIIKTGVYIEEIQKYCHLIYALDDYSKCKHSISKLLYRLKIKYIYKWNTKNVYKHFIKDKYDVEVAFLEGFSTKFVSCSSNLKSTKYAWVHIDVLNNHNEDSHYKNLEEQKNCYKSFNHIFAVSNNVKGKFIEKFNLNNIDVQYNPVDSGEIIKKAQCQQNTIDENNFNLITIGRLEEQKGYDRLLKIVKKLRDNNYTFKLYILGDGSLKEQFEKYIVENNLDNYIKLLGFKNNPYPYLNIADVFVCSSYAEGFSTVATEALILGVPIITTDCAGMKELFGNYHCGLIVNNDEDSLYGALKYILDNKENLNIYKNEINKRKDFFDIKKRMIEIEDILDGK